MKELGKGNSVLIEAYNRGYRVLENGTVVSHIGNIRKPNKNRRGYLRFNYRRLNGESCLIPIHRLQAYQKYGDKLFEADCVRHLDSDKLNNSYSNIAIGSIMDNWMDIKEEDRKRICATANIKYPIKTVVEIRGKYKNGSTINELMKEYRISNKGTVSYLINKRIINI